MKVPLTELDDRMNRFRARMDRTQPGWELAAITDKIPLYYFTGTMQDGLLADPAGRRSGLLGPAELRAGVRRVAFSRTPEDAELP